MGMHIANAKQDSSRKQVLTIDRFDANPASRRFFKATESIVKH
jgi:hypothetical protein